VNNIINAKVKFVRNLSGVKFSTKITPKIQSETLEICLKACNELGLKGESLSNISNNVLNQLVSSNKIEQEFVKNIKNKGYVSGDDVSIQINGLNHVEIFANQINILDAYSKAKQVDKQLCNKLHFSYNDKYGFLSPEIDKIGSGMQISVIVLLPALTKMNALNNLPKFNDKLRFSIKALDMQSGLYRISTGANLGYSEKQICDLTCNYIENILKVEVEFCKTLASDKPEVMDKNLRAKAIINNCIKMSIDELYCLIGDMLIAINSGVEIDVDDKQIKKLINCINSVVTTEIDLAKNIKGIIN